jgi:hypothetical protein
VSEAPIPSAPADLDLIAQLRSRLQYAELRIRALEEQLRLMRIEKYAARGEKLSQAQMELIVQAESECKPVLLAGPESAISESCTKCLLWGSVRRALVAISARNSCK